MSIARFATLALVLVLAPAAAPTPDTSETVTVRMTDFKLEPEIIHLRARQPYVLRFVNSSRGGQDFTAEVFFAAASVDPSDRMRLRGGRLELHGGESFDLHLVAPGPGSFAVRCAHYVPTIFGLNGKIVVG